jgi:FkbM family methyltransferase
MIQLSQRVMLLGSRFRKILAFGRAGSSTLDMLKLMVVGYARGHTFSGAGPISRAGRILFPEIAISPSLLSGLTLHLDPSDLSQLVVAEEILLEQVYDLNRVLFVPDVILDCGAHTGMFTVLAASKFPNSKLISFEPDPANYRWLETQKRTNHLRVDLLRAAVSTADGEALFEAGRGCGSALTANSSFTSDAITVKTLDLSKYIEMLSCERLLLKLDVEGAEEQLLPKIVNVLPADCFLFLETHGGEESWMKSSRLLERHGFAVTVTRRREIYTDGVAIRTSKCRTA